MSRIGRQPITIPAGVEVNINEDEHLVAVKGPKGSLSRVVNDEMGLNLDGGVLTVTRPTDAKPHKAMHGLTRTLINNMVVGVTQGYQRPIELYGVGYRATMQGQRVLLQVGFSHPVEVFPPEGVSVHSLETFTPTTANGWLSARFVVEGIDKELVGQTASEIRRIRPAEPYKGKGFRYRGEVIRRKAGKARKAGGKGKK